jgi:GTP diphosphokinase / guanosine-3',5'-bis(diphosphate) 3'-diphosphatase
LLRQYELVERVRSYHPEADEDLLNRAYVFSVKVHGSQKRASGDPYFSHPIEVAGILTDLRLDEDTIVTAILHDTIEDTVATYDQIEHLFGPKIAKLVDGVTKLSKIEALTESERAAENLRKFLLAMSDDIRVLLVKLADRLHNMRTLHFIKNPERRARIARETVEIYAPLAERIGMYEFKDELFEIAFKELEPAAFESIVKRLDVLHTQFGDVAPRVATEIGDAMQASGIAASVQFRQKRPYSIWKKLSEKHLTFEQLSDVIAFRILVPTADECYRALGIVHRTWPMVPGRFKDFISVAKANGYRSLHTTVIGPRHMRIEIQIRTPEMHEQAEMGVAAHWSYKQGVKPKTVPRLPWLEDLVEMLDHGGSAEELLEHTKLHIYQNQVFCFTPKGELIAIPRGGTAVDFAYAVHTRLGDTCVGVKVNGKSAPLRAVLQNGDQVQVLTSKGQIPQASWLSFVITGKARSAIRRAIRGREREEFMRLGSALLNAVIERLPVKLSATALKDALVRLKLPDQDALHVALGSGALQDADVREAIMPGSIKKGRASAAATDLAAGADLPEQTPISIKGLTPGLGYQLADCCHPVPGDRIVGIRESGRGVTVHTIDCESLEQLAHVPDRWLDLAWDDKGKHGEFTARLAVVAQNQRGALAQITSVIAESDANIGNLKVSHRDPAFHSFLIDIEVRDLAHLTKIIAALRAAQVVSTVDRVRS